VKKSRGVASCNPSATFDLKENESPSEEWRIVRNEGQETRPQRQSTTHAFTPFDELRERNRRGGRLPAPTQTQTASFIAVQRASRARATRKKDSTPAPPPAGSLHRTRAPSTQLSSPRPGSAPRRTRLGRAAGIGRVIACREGSRFRYTLLDGALFTPRAPGPSSS
jgi:hypothetical protein